MKPEALKHIVVDDSLDQVLQDSLFLEERRSEGYIRVMTHIQRALDHVLPRKITVDLRDITSRRGSLIYFIIEGAAKEIPFDLLYAPRLKHSIREILIKDLEAHKMRLSLTHRRQLSRLQRVQKLDGLVDSEIYDVNHQTELTLKEIERLLDISERAHGVRKMDVLMEALLIPGRTYFDFLQTLQCLEDADHPRHAEVLVWLQRGKYFGRVAAFESAIQEAFRRLGMAAETIYDRVEEVTGLKFSRDLENVETESGWFGLGPVAREEEAVEDAARKELRQRLHHSRFQEIKRCWSLDWFEDREMKVREWAGDDPQRQATGLARLLLELQKKVIDAPKPAGVIQLALENDLNLHMISKLDYDDSRAWILENWKDLVGFMDTLVTKLETLTRQHPGVVLPEVLDMDLNRVSALNTQNIHHMQEALANRFKALDVHHLEDDVNQLELGEGTDAATIRELFTRLDQVEDGIARVTPGNVPFLRQLRLVHERRAAFEAEVEELYHKQDSLERLRQKLEARVFQAYRRLDRFSSLETEELDRCLEVTVHNMYTGLANNVYAGIDMNIPICMMADAVEQEDQGECFLRLDYLLQELHAMPKASVLLEALKSWSNGDPQELEHRRHFIKENEGKRQELESQLVRLLRQRLGCTDKESRRVRFEVFGFEACLAEALERSLHILVDELPKITSQEDGAAIAEDVAALEERLIEAQALSRGSSRFGERIESMLRKGEIDAAMEQQLSKDLQTNYHALEALMEEASTALKRTREQQIRFGLVRDTRYLNLTLNLTDLEELKAQYGFLDAVCLEDLKRYCLAYRMSRDMLADLLRKLENGSADVAPEIRKQYAGKARKSFLASHLSPSPKQGGEMTAVLKVTILRYNNHIFETEAQRLIYFLNFADPKLMTSRETYRNYLALFKLAEDGDVKVNRCLKHLVTRLRACMFEYKPEGYHANYEHNRRTFVAKLDTLRDDLEWY